jgi:hypothetical protein
MITQKVTKRWFRKNLQMQGTQKLRSEAYLHVRCNDEVEAQSCSEQDRWTFYETINFHFSIPLGAGCSLSFQNAKLMQGG